MIRIVGEKFSKGKKMKIALKRGLMSLISAAVLLNGCSKGAPAFQRPPSSVTVAEVTKADVPIYLETIGNIVSPNTVQVKPQVTGILLQAYVKQGQAVKKGQPLYKIDPSMYQAAVDKANATLAKDQATLKFTKVKLDRYAELVKQDYIAQITYEELQSQVETAEAQIEIDQAILKEALIDLERTSIVSPIHGRISRFNIDPGNLVTANEQTSLTEIRQINPIDVQFSFPQKEFQILSTKQSEAPIQLEIIRQDQKPGMGSKGVVYFIDNKIDQTTGTIQLKGRASNAEEELWPGQFVRVRAFLGTHPNALLVPIEAVQVGQKGPYVYIVKKDTTVELRNVKTASIVAEKMVITEGLEAGETVVVSGQLNLFPNAPVNIVKPQSTPAEPPPSKTFY